MRNTANAELVCKLLVSPRLLQEVPHGSHGAAGQKLAIREFVCDRCEFGGEAVRPAEEGDDGRVVLADAENANGSVEHGWGWDADQWRSVLT